MKKAKVILSAVALFAVVGGALAFKATREENTFYRNTLTTINGVQFTYCTAPFTTTLTTEPVAGQAGQRLNTLYHIATSTTCPGTVVYTVN